MNFQVLVGDFICSDKNFWFPIIGCALIHWSLGIAGTFGNTVPYVASYMLLHGNSNLCIGTVCWIESFFILFQGGANYLYPIIEHIIGFRSGLAIGFLFCTVGLLVSYLSLNSYLFYLFGYSVLYATGNGILFASTSELLLNNYSTNVRSKIIGLIWMFRGASMSILPSIQSSFVNPNNHNSYFVLNGSKLFGSLSLLEKVPKLMNLTLIFSTTFQLLGVAILILRSKHLNTVQRQGYAINKGFSLVYMIFGSESLILLWLITFLTWPCIEYIQVFWKVHGMINTSLGDLQLTRISCIVTVLQTLFRVFWGVFGQLAGHFNCICALSIILVMGIILLIFPVIEGLSTFQYTLGYLLVSIAQSGNSAVYPATILNHYSQFNKMELFIYLFSAKVTSCIFFCIFTNATTRIFSINYSLVPLLIFSLGSFFLSFVLKDIKSNQMERSKE
ncbi:putative membrane associated transporter [Cryptosporidium canis]|uniref:Membrane associated transporter n=1 Tax=Cryptosporidium canis TaxID=195482 RepID=A0A9D5DK63_9CRYT|nr:putative membrane associated transporter [Cryptosporidium canis]